MAFHTFGICWPASSQQFYRNKSQVCVSGNQFRQKFCKKPICHKGSAGAFCRHGFSFDSSFKQTGDFFNWSCFKNLGGEIQTGFKIDSLKQLPSSRAVLLDVTPLQLLSIAGEQFSKFYKWQLSRYNYGEGVYKIDWALSQPVPFTNEKCRKATTIHIGGSFDEIYQSEYLISQNTVSDKPFVLLVQPGVVDSSRAPEGKQTAWAYCHVPNGSQQN